MELLDQQQREMLQPVTGWAPRSSRRERPGQPYVRDLACPVLCLLSPVPGAPGGPAPQPVDTVARAVTQPSSCLPALLLCPTPARLCPDGATAASSSFVSSKFPSAPWVPALWLLTLPLLSLPST